MFRSGFVKAVFFSLFLIFLCGGFVSCDGEINLELISGTPNEGGMPNAESTLKISFSGTCGAALRDMILAASGGDEVFDTAEISNQLKNAGFSSVDVKAQGARLSLSIRDEGCKSYLFKSDVVSVQGSGAGARLLGSINQKNLKAFYDSSDEQIQMLLDLFLAPVFNDEKMSASDYTELIGAVYGEDTKKEIGGSKITISVKNPDGTSVKKSLDLAALLCGQEIKW